MSAVNVIATCLGVLNMVFFVIMVFFEVSIHRRNRREASLSKSAGRRLGQGGDAK